MKEKKLKSSVLVVILYVFAALVLLYAFYQVYSAATAVTSYYNQMNASPKASEIIGYILQAVVEPLAMALLLFGAGHILRETRALNPANYVTVEKPVSAPASESANKGAKSVAEAEKKEVTTGKKPAAKKPAAKKDTTTKKPTAKKETTAKKPVAKKETTAKKPVAKKETTAKKAATKKTEAK